MIEIGINDGDVQVDPAKLVAGCGLVTGKRGTGKSYLVRVIVEQAIAAGVQVIVLDPEGEFGTLREKCDVLVAGPRGDLPVWPSSAKLLARKIAELGCSVVIDMSDLVPEEQAVVVEQVLTGLDRLPRELERSRLVVIDEAHQFAPEQGKDRSVATKAVIALMSRGRKRGLGALLVTQRLAKLRNDAAAEVGHYFIFSTSPIDLDAAQKLLGQTKEEAKQLRGMPRGTCYVHIEAENVTRRIAVRGAATTHPEPGMRHKVVPPPPRRALMKLIAELRDHSVPKVDGGEGDRLDAAPLRIKIRELEKELAAAAERVRVAERFRHGVSSIIGQLEALIGGPVEPEQPPPPKAETHSAKRHEAPRPAPSPRAVKPPPRPAASSSGALPFAWTAVPGRLLTVLIQHNGTWLAPKRVAALAGVRFGRSTWRNALAALRRHALLAESDEGFAASDAAMRHAGDVEPLPSGPEMISGWRSRLGGVPLQIFDYLLAQPDPGDGADRHRMVEELRISSGSTLRNAIALLRKHGLADDARRGNTVRLCDHVIEALAQRRRKESRR